MTNATGTRCRNLALLFLAIFSVSQGFTTVFKTPRTSRRVALSSSTGADISKPTELPDSLEDAAEIAANACADFAEQAGALGRCRVDFDTSAGDETYTLLKQSTEFMQNLVSFVSYRMVPGLMEQRQQEIMKVAQARAELQALLSTSAAADDDGGGGLDNVGINQERKAELIQILANNGRDPESKWEGPVVRVYFPDEGNAALARRDWMGDEPKVPPCVQFSSCGGVRYQDVKKDIVVFFFCPKASESQYVEELLKTSETEAEDLKLTVFVNPNLVDMGVTGFGMAGRMLRERLIDPLTNVYYLRTLPWGALTRVWPKTFSVWQEDADAEGGYKLIWTGGKLPSNPEVEDIYDIKNGDKGERRSGGPLDQFGDFVQGMMRL